jgi:hypothetical protein
MLDTFGKSPPDPRRTKSIYEVTEESIYKKVGKRLSDLSDALDIPSSLQLLCAQVVTELEANAITSRGVTKDGLCLAIIHHVHDNLGIFFDLGLICKDTKLKPVKIIALSKSFNKISSNEDKMTKLQKLVYSTADKLNICINNIDRNIIDIVNEMSRSTKMKTALILYRAAPPKVQEIIKHIGVQMDQLLKADKQID